MTYLFAQTTGLLVAVAVIATITGGSNRSALRLPAVAAVVTLMAVQAIAQFPLSEKDLNGTRRASKGTTTAALLNGCNGTDPTVTRFFSWVRAALPKGARYYYVHSSRLPGDSPCVTLSLLPGIQLDKPSGAQYLVFAGEIPPDWQTTLARGQLMMFAPNYGLVRVS